MPIYFSPKESLNFRSVHLHFDWVYVRDTILRHKIFLYPYRVEIARKD